MWHLAEENIPTPNLLTDRRSNSNECTCNTNHISIFAYGIGAFSRVVSITDVREVILNAGADASDVLARALDRGIRWAALDFAVWAAISRCHPICFCT